jgi:hypothetical protein
MQTGIYINVHTDSDGGDRLENLLLLKDLIEAGKLKPAIDRVYPLQQIVEAHRYVEQGHISVLVRLPFLLACCFLAGPITCKYSQQINYKRWQCFSPIYTRMGT